MSSVLRHKSATETFVRDEGTYTPRFLYWKGYVERHPLLNTVLEADADAAFASWKTEGENATTMAQILDTWTGTGKENFKSIMKNLSVISKVGGDSYAEIIIDDIPDVAEEVPSNLITLPPDNITQEIKNGRIKKYYELNPGTRGQGRTEWKPEELLHMVTGRIGASTHGTSLIEPLQNILLHKEQLLLTGSKIFELYTQPITLVPLKTDSTAEMTKWKNQWNQINATDQKVLFYSEDNVGEIKRVGVPEGSTLDPGKWINGVLDPEILKRFRVSEVILGTGTVNSEESARYQFTGFRQTIRATQTKAADDLRQQVFIQAYPDNTPKIRFSFATEAQEEKWNRDQASIANYAQTLTFNPEMQQLLIVKKLIEMGEIPNA